MTFGGGFPIFCGDEVIGAIGVSGGSVEEDEMVARAGLKIITEGSEF
ncbi:MAG TPA: heme-binding protein [Tepidanaerobacteraceae bacterium]|nr:heme-binding protein [Tepidanaerobacteraceae bacterium]